LVLLYQKPSQISKTSKTNTTHRPIARHVLLDATLVTAYRSWSVPISV